MNECSGEAIESSGEMESVERLHNKWIRTYEATLLEKELHITVLAGVESRNNAVTAGAAKQYPAYACMGWPSMATL
jgi:hypothetical protein